MVIQLIRNKFRHYLRNFRILAEDSCKAIFGKDIPRKWVSFFLIFEKSIAFILVWCKITLYENKRG